MQPTLAHKLILSLARTLPLSPHPLPVHAPSQPLRAQSDLSEERMVRFHTRRFTGAPRNGYCSLPPTLPHSFFSSACGGLCFRLHVFVLLFIRGRCKILISIGMLWVGVIAIPLPCYAMLCYSYYTTVIPRRSHVMLGMCSRLLYYDCMIGSYSSLLYYECRHGSYD